MSLSPASAEGADRKRNRRTGSRVPGCRAAAPSSRRCRPGGRHRRSHIVVPAPVLSSQIPFPTEYPDGFTTFTPSIATTPCRHTAVTVPALPGRPDVFSSPSITTHLLPAPGIDERLPIRNWRMSRWPTAAWSPCPTSPTQIDSRPASPLRCDGHRMVRRRRRSSRPRDDRGRGR
jgi:hypothetical protein